MSINLPQTDSLIREAFLCSPQEQRSLRQEQLSHNLMEKIERSVDALQGYSHESKQRIRNHVIEILDKRQRVIDEKTFSALTPGNVMSSYQPEEIRTNFFPQMRWKTVALIVVSVLAFVPFFCAVLKSKAPPQMSSEPLPGAAADHPSIDETTVSKFVWPACVGDEHIGQEIKWSINPFYNSSTPLPAQPLSAQLTPQRNQEINLTNHDLGQQRYTPQKRSVPKSQKPRQQPRKKTIQLQFRKPPHPLTEHGDPFNTDPSSLTGQISIYNPSSASPVSLLAKNSKANPISLVKDIITGIIIVIILKLAQSRLRTHNVATVESSSDATHQRPALRRKSSSSASQQTSNAAVRSSDPIHPRPAMPRKPSSLASQQPSNATVGSSDATHQRPAMPRKPSSSASQQPSNAPVGSSDAIHQRPALPRKPSSSASQQPSNTTVGSSDAIHQRPALPREPSSSASQQPSNAINNPSGSISQNARRKSQSNPGGIVKLIFGWDGW